MNGIPENQMLEDVQNVSLTILTGKKRNKISYGYCQCGCGEIAPIAKYTDKRFGHVKGYPVRFIAGHNSKLQSQGNFKHGYSKTKTYRSWQGMRSRCNNPANKNYKEYGARGIKVCIHWNKFENFLEDMGERPRGLTIERINNDKNYSPDNCKWATRKEQARNTRRNRMICYKEMTRCLADWAELTGIGCVTLAYRLNHHSPEIAFNMHQKNYNLKQVEEL